MSALEGLRLARLFHDTYERLAPSFGYTTREDTREFNPETPNGRLMIAVCAEIARLDKEQPASPAPAAGEPSAKVPEGWQLILEKVITDLLEMRKLEAQGIAVFANSDDTMFENCIDRLRALAAAPKEDKP